MYLEIGLGKLIGQSHPRQVLLRIGIPGLFGIDHRGCLGQVLTRLVVVGDDHIHPQRRCQGNFAQRSDAAIHGDDQTNPFFSQAGDRLLVQPVALIIAVGDVNAPIHTQV